MNYNMIELAYLRNQLACERFFERDNELLDKVKIEISNGSSRFKKIALNAIHNCEEDIKSGDLKSAAQEMRLIHNFPFDNAEKWNEDYFYRIELLSYIEQIDDSKRIKNLIHLLGALDSTNK